MIVSAKTNGADGLAERLARTLTAPLSAQAMNAAAATIRRVAAEEGIALEAQERDGRLVLGTDDPQAVARETGSLDTPAEPWLQPLLSGLRRRR